MYVAEQAGLGMTWSQTPKTSFLPSRPITVNLEIFARILFLRKALEDIFAKFKFRD